MTALPGSLATTVAPEAAGFCACASCDTVTKAASITKMALCMAIAPLKNDLQLNEFRMRCACFDGF
jgi:hypothetical protein